MVEEKVYLSILMYRAYLSTGVSTLSPMRTMKKGHDSYKSRDLSILRCCHGETRLFATMVPDAATAGTPMPGKVESPQRYRPATSIASESHSTSGLNITSAVGLEESRLVSAERRI